jgi:HD-like signal output (HDOD) protein
VWGFIVLLILVLIYWRFFLTPKQKPLAKRIASLPSQTQKNSAPLVAKPTMPSPIEIPLNRDSHEQLDNFQLLQLEESDQKTLAKMQNVIQSIPRPHPMIRSLLASNNSEDLYKLVKSDAFIAAKVLQEINSGQFYLSKKITRLNHAILYLGANTIKNIAFQCLMNTTSAVKDKELKRALEKIWAHGFLASSLAYVFAKNLGLTDAAELGTQALLSYVGNLAILYYDPSLSRSFDKDIMLLERLTIEQQSLHTNAALVGSQLAKAWNLPDVLINSIHDSLLPLATPAAQCTLQGSYLRNIVLCYLSCRVGELILEHEMDDITKLDLFDEDLIELYYLPDYFQMTGLNTIYNLLTKPAIQREINKLIKNMT